MKIIEVILDFFKYFSGYIDLKKPISGYIINKEWNNKVWKIRHDKQCPNVVLSQLYMLHRITQIKPTFTLYFYIFPFDHRTVLVIIITRRLQFKKHLFLFYNIF